MFYAFKTTLAGGKDYTNYHVTDTSFLTSGNLEHCLRFAWQFSVPQPQVSTWM